MIIKTVTSISIAILSLSTSAHAAVQAWRLTATSYQVQSGLTPPPFAQVGNSFQIDYVIETMEPSTPGWGGMFSSAVKSFTINDVTSQAEGYISAHGGLNAINIWPSTTRIDGIDFISFNNFSGAYNADVTSALSEFSAAAQTTSTDLRVDFGDLSIWAKPSSFAMIEVPEPTTTLLLLIGMPIVLLRAYGSRTRAA